MRGPLDAAAFGPDPCAVVRLAPGAPPGERWRAAVVLGGQGRFAAAVTLLRDLLADPRTPPAVAAHAAVTLAAHRRQQGGHALARPLDARGLRLAAAAPSGPPCPDGTDAGAAAVDALVGLAADALGLGDRAAGRLLDAAQERGHPSWRTAVRIGWVQAEAALFAGEAARGLEPAERALERARAGGGLRHVVKSRLVLAVVRAVAHPDGAVLAELDAVADAASGAGLLPLVGPARLAAADLAHHIESPSVTGSSLNANDGADDRSDEAVNGRMSGPARRRHAAALSANALYQFSDPVGRGLMGESVQRVP
ncbi:hypothetical protein I4I73_05265 [Pseudonocardia sp. KRD-184]|uniref:Uncharacterized protein n=1 Tax=Pseudonocardia oceani TaxID=2792013 RepID=A0ABS6U6T5_9PSEU|nr:hypothetical protein [Pseudonocardia oceani]MBW0089787.1 hypothetical protein [Pseudonocardia oceani]MBW0095403.1 hypothetical protein [Pseudonocardia oceani]MBW0108816.1 hypothetical protein [Pseudonocardia oceani]MBW0122217.1 hypothetical protein [Pseudonocardia oceani]MBW0127925.1 hypothetical protein [Pseudonocardia oceani]